MAERLQVGLTLLIGFVVIVPTAIVMGWVASWRGPWWARWGVLAGVGVVSVSCLGYGFAMPRTQITPETCSWAPGCTSSTPLYWMLAGLAGTGIVVLLAFAGLIVEVIRATRPRGGAMRTARPPRRTAALPPAPHAPPGDARLSRRRRA
jgi:hypothetical protein